MIADIVEMILVDDICDFVDLYSSLLRINFGLPADVNYRDALVSDEKNEQDRYPDALGWSEENRNRLLFVDMKDGRRKWH